MDRWISDRLGHSVYNPNVESDTILSRVLPNGNFRLLKTQDLARYIVIVRDLIDRDIQEIAQRTDYVICNWDESAQRGAGTKGEVTMARYTGKPVYLVTEMNHQDIPGWVLGCATKIFGSFDELREFLLQEYAQ